MIPTVSKDEITSFHEQSRCGYYLHISNYKLLLIKLIEPSQPLPKLHMCVDDTISVLSFLSASIPLACMYQGQDFRKVGTLRNGAVHSKQNPSNDHEFVV